MISFSFTSCFFSPLFRFTSNTPSNECITMRLSSLASKAIPKGRPHSTFSSECALSNECSINLLRSTCSLFYSQQDFPKLVSVSILSPVILATVLSLSVAYMIPSRVCKFSGESNRPLNKTSALSSFVLSASFPVKAFGSTTLRKSISKCVRNRLQKHNKWQTHMIQQACNTKISPLDGSPSTRWSRPETCEIK